MLCGFSSFFYILLLFFFDACSWYWPCSGWASYRNGVGVWLAGWVEWDRVNRSRSRARWVNEG